MEVTIKPILPSPKNYPDNIIKAIDSAIFRSLTGPVKDTIKSALEARIEDWVEKPRIGYTYRRPSNDQFVLHVFPTGNSKLVLIWKWVSLGTKEDYPISPVNASALRIREGYRPRTKPGNQYRIAGGGRFYGETYYTPNTVYHPGIEARQFEQHVADEKTTEVTKKIQRDIYMAVIRS